MTPVCNNTSLETIHSKQIITSKYRDLILKKINEEVRVTALSSVIVAYLNFEDDESFERIFFFTAKLKELPWIGSFFEGSTYKLDLIAERFLRSGTMVELTDNPQNYAKVVTINGTVIAEKSGLGASLDVAELAITYFQEHRDYFRFCLLDQDVVKDYSFDLKGKLRSFKVSTEELLRFCKGLTFEEISTREFLHNSFPCLCPCTCP
jgi:hypothetical protein